MLYLTVFRNTIDKGLIALFCSVRNQIPPNWHKPVFTLESEADDHEACEKLKMDAKKELKRRRIIAPIIENLE